MHKWSSTQHSLQAINARMTQRTVVVGSDISLTCPVLAGGTQPHLIVHQRLPSDHAHWELGTAVFTTCVPIQKCHCDIDNFYPLAYVYSL